MLPESEYGPAELLECERMTVIASNVGVEFFPPPTGVVLWLCPVQWAAVPEASVDEDNQFRSGENDVTATSQRSVGAVVNPISKTLSVQNSPHR